MTDFNEAGAALDDALDALAEQEWKARQAKPTRVLVCGSRHWTDAAQIRGMLDHQAAAYGPLTVIHGAAPGADAIAGKWARDNGHTELAFPADWARHGAIRNQQMLLEGDPDIVVAFPVKESRGTWDMVRRAENAGLPVYVWPAP